MKYESIITLVSLIVFSLSSFIIAFALPILLSNTYANGNYTFDLTACVTLLNLYGVSLVIAGSITVGLLIHDFVLWCRCRYD